MYFGASNPRSLKNNQKTRRYLQRCGLLLTPRTRTVRVEKTAPWTTLVSLCPSIGQYRIFCSASVCSALAALARKSRLFRKVQYTKHKLPVPARKLQLLSTSVAHKEHVGSWSWKVATFQFKCSSHWQLQVESVQLFSTSEVHKVHFGSSSWKVTTVQ